MEEPLQQQQQQTLLDLQLQEQKQQQLQEQQEHQDPTTVPGNLNKAILSVLITFLLLILLYFNILSLITSFSNLLFKSGTLFLFVSWNGTCNNFGKKPEISSTKDLTQAYLYFLLELYTYFYFVRTNFGCFVSCELFSNGSTSSWTNRWLYLLSHMVSVRPFNIISLLQRFQHQRRKQPHRRLLQPRSPISTRQSCFLSMSRAISTWPTRAMSQTRAPNHLLLLKEEWFHNSRLEGYKVKQRYFCNLNISFKICSISLAAVRPFILPLWNKTFLHLNVEVWFWTMLNMKNFKDYLLSFSSIIQTVKKL